MSLFKVYFVTVRALTVSTAGPRTVQKQTNKKGAKASFIAEISTGQLVRNKSGSLSTNKMTFRVTESKRLTKLRIIKHVGKRKVVHSCCEDKLVPSLWRKVCQ